MLSCSNNTTCHSDEVSSTIRDDQPQGLQIIQPQFDAEVERVSYPRKDTTPSIHTEDVHLQAPQTLSGPVSPPRYSTPGGPQVVHADTNLLAPQAQSSALSHVLLMLVGIISLNLIISMMYHWAYC